MKRSTPIWMFFFVILLVTLKPGLSVSDQSGGIEDVQVRPKPYPAPPLPLAGGRYVDPAFGTTIIRVTDENDGFAATTMYSYWPSFNKDSTLFFIGITIQEPWGRSTVPFLYAFDDATGTPKKLGRLWGPILLQPEGAIWSGREGEVLFGLSATRLFRFNALKKSYTMLKDFKDLCPSTSCTGWQMSKGADDRLFAFTLKDATRNYREIKAVVWDSSHDKTYALDIPSNFTNYDESHLDKSGQWLIVIGYPHTLVWDFVGGRIQKFTHIGHYDVGYGTIVSTCPGEKKPVSCVIDLSRPASGLPIFERPTKNGRVNWQTDKHTSWLANDQATVFMGHFAAAEIGGFVRHSGAIYRRDGASKAASGFGVAFPPEIMRHNGRDLAKVNAMPTAPGQWYLDTAANAYFVWLYRNADATDTKKNKITALDWFPLMDEIVQHWTDGSMRFRRLAHHRSGYWNYTSAPRGNIDPSGRYFIYTSNWDGSTNSDGSPRTDVFILIVPGARGEPGRHSALSTRAASASSEASQ